MFFRHETLAAEPRERDKRRAVRFSTRVVRKLVRALKAGFHMIPDDRGSQKVQRSSAIIWKHTFATVCDTVIVIVDDRRR